MLIDNLMLASLLEQAKAGGRQRMHHDLRTDAGDTSQRMLNALLPGTCVPIHRHRESTETVLVLSGRLTEILYDEQGVECARYELDPKEGRFGLQIPKGVWHTVVVKEPCVIFEAKDGAYAPPTAADVWNYE